MRVAQENEIYEIYDANIRLLSDWLRESVQSIDEQELWKRIKVEYNDEGYPLCTYQLNGKQFRITSEKPVSEAAQWYESYPNMEGSGAVFLYGCGFGYPIIEIFSHKMSHTLVIVFEDDMYLFKAMLYFFDFAPIFKTGKIVFLIGDSNNFIVALEQLLYSVFFVNCTYPAVAFTHAAKRNFKQTYIQLHKDVFQILSLVIFNIGNDHKDNLLGFTNIMANIRQVIQNPDISSLKDKYKGYPAFIIANGPSLDKNIQQLKNIRGKGLIICVESAIVPLLKNEIKPDILSVIERIRDSFVYHFKDVDYPDDIALLGLALIHPSIYTIFPGERIPIFRAMETMNRWAARNLGDGSMINAGNNVSHLAAETAIYLGASPIVFVGQDYAFGPSEETNSKDSVDAKTKGGKAYEFMHTFPSAYVDGNNGAPVLTNSLWLSYREGLELIIASYPGITFINATEGGAKILGARCVELKDAIGQYCTRQIPGRVNGWIHASKALLSRSSRRDRLEKFTDEIRHNSTMLRNAAKQVTEGSLACKNVLRYIRLNENGEYSSMIEEAYQNNVRIINGLIKQEMILCFTQQIIFISYYLLNRIGKIDTPEKITEVFNIQYRMLCRIGTICQSVSVHFEDALNLLEKEGRDWE